MELVFISTPTTLPPLPIQSYSYTNKTFVASFWMVAYFIIRGWEGLGQMIEQSAQFLYRNNHLVLFLKIEVLDFSTIFFNVQLFPMFKIVCYIFLSFLDICYLLLFPYILYFFIFCYFLLLLVEFFSFLLFFIIFLTFAAF